MVIAEATTARSLLSLHRILPSYLTELGCLANCLASFNIIHVIVADLYYCREEDREEEGITMWKRGKDEDSRERKRGMREP